MTSREHPLTRAVHRLPASLLLGLPTLTNAAGVYASIRAIGTGAVWLGLVGIVCSLLAWMVALAAALNIIRNRSIRPCDTK